MIVVAGAGAIGASVAYHLALLGAREVVLCDRGEVAGGSTARAMGGVRQQFSTAAEVRLAQASIAFFEELGPPFFRQVGYLFLATTPEGLERLERRAALQRSLGVPVEPAPLPFGVEGGDVLGAFACRKDGLADPPAVTRELVRRAAGLGVRVEEGVDARTLDREVLVVCCGPWSAELAPALPVRPLCRQLLETGPLELDERLPMVVEEETGFHFRRRRDRLVLAMSDPEPRWGFETAVDESLFGDRLARLAHRFPPAAGTEVADAWAGLYDMTPDAHPVVGRVGEGVYAACGFSGHGFMQSPAVGRALAEEIVLGASSLDLSPYRLERFGAEPEFPETLVL
ncbi:MAG TPA: FAD-binding oxidoreductase [Gaiellaceae bacterium]|nr:FAD-binding oxidoreductase [Gaiellaceae bacterium]